MDRRITFKDDKQLLSIFLDLEKQQQQASLLIDDEGLTRIEGNVNRIEQAENWGKTKIIIDSNEPIDLAQVIAVNGLFRDDYSEC